jgi:hypothetical protein
MRGRIALLALVVSLVAAGDGLTLQFYTLARDEGYILGTEDERILARGQHGDYVLEPLGVCIWCTEGSRMELKFQGLGRAILFPWPKSPLKRPIPVLVTRDGRFE